MNLPFTGDTNNQRSLQEMYYAAISDILSDTQPQGMFLAREALALHAKGITAGGAE